MTVLCYFPWKPWQESNLKEETIEGVKVKRIKNYLITAGKYGRFLNRFILPFDFFSALSGQNFDVIHIAGVHHLTYAAILFAKLKGIPVVISLYGEELRTFDDIKSRGFLKGLKLKIRLLIYKLVFKSAGEVSCSSKSLQDGLEKLNIRKSSRIIYNGVNVSKLNNALQKDPAKMRKKYSIPNDKIVLGSIGGISARKGYDILIDVFALVCEKNTNLYLVIVGGGDIQLLRDQAAKNGVEQKISFLGALDYEQLLEVYPVMDIYVQFPIQEEGVSQTTIEASMMRKPVIVSDCGAMRDSVNAGKSGYIFPIEDKKAIAQAILGFAKDENLRKKIGAFGRKWVAENFSYDKIASQYLDIFQKGGAK